MRIRQSADSWQTADGSAPAWAIARTILVVLVPIVIVACGTPELGPVTDGISTEQNVPASIVGGETGLEFLGDREVYLPQFAGGDDGSLYVVWQEREVERGANLYIARRGAGGIFEPQGQINDLPGTVGGGSLDEGRAGVAIGDNGVIAVAWTARGSDIRAAFSTDSGAHFSPSVVLNSDEGSRSYRGFVDIDIDAAGIAHAAWIDGRFAPRGAEEPADLYYARIENGEVTEINLTEHQIDSICGCCRIDVDVRRDDGIAIAFRNTGGGYRDIWRMEAGGERVFNTPIRLGPPMWELRGCPVIGPLNVGDATLWSEASTGKRRILVATETGGDYEVVLEDTGEWAIERPPRLVTGSDPAQPLLLLPGRPNGVILQGAGLDWAVVVEGIPRWGLSAAIIDGSLVLIGDLNGEFQTYMQGLKSSSHPIF